MNDFFPMSFPTEPFRQQARRVRDLRVEEQLSGLRGPKIAPTTTRPDMLRGVDLAATARRQGDMASAPGLIRMAADFDEDRLRRQLEVAEARRRDRLMAQKINATGKAVGSGMRYANALVGKYLMPKADSFFSGLNGVDNSPSGATDLVDPRMDEIGRTA